MLKHLTFCLFLTLFFSKQTLAQAKVDSTAMITLRLDPQNARGAAVSQLFDEVKFIPLETTKESLFGSISDLKIVKENYLIFDWDTKAILIFTKEGKFKIKIDATRIQKDKADNSKSEFYGFTTVEENNESLIQIYTDKHVYYFDLDGKQVKKVLNKDVKSNYDFKYADNKTIVRPNFLLKNGKDSTFYEVGIFNGKDSVGYFPYAIKRYETDEFWGGGSRFYEYGVDNEMFYLNYYDYNLYKIAPNKLSLAYRIVFPANNSLPKDFITNPIYIKKRGEYFRNNPKVFYSLSSTYLIGNNLYLKMSNYGWDQDLKKSIIYNLKSGELISIQDLEPDSLSSFLPITDASGNFHDFRNHGFHLFKDGYFYTSYSSLAMFTFKEQLSNKYDKFAPEMQDYFKNQNKKSNPILIQLKPKKD
ncbi:MAG: 6-bladed beta-propeller [Pedobacter sp.]|nr:6-bladed beta-propeller [Pedobacter sp.]